MTGIEAVSIHLKLSKTCQLERGAANLFSSRITANLSSIYNPVTARSMSLDSSARPVIRDPKSSNLGF
jgi:hypothetical protein